MVFYSVVLIVVISRLMSKVDRVDVQAGAIVVISLGILDYRDLFNVLPSDVLFAWYVVVLGTVL